MVTTGIVRAKAIVLPFLAAVLTCVGMASANAQTLDRIRNTGTLKLGYDPDARPFSFKTNGDAPDGYAVALCNEIADALRPGLTLPELRVEWIPLPSEKRPTAVTTGLVDIVCGAQPVTLTRRQEVSFSIPIFPSGTGAAVSTSAPVALREVLENGQAAARPIWRGSPARTILEHKTFSAVAGSTAERWLADRINTFQLAATTVPVGNFEDGIERVHDGRSAVLFGDMALLMDAAARSSGSGDLLVLKRHFTFQPLALELARGDEDFRLSVDGALSHVYAAPDFRAFFTIWFGPPDAAVETFFRQTTLPN